ncbi:Iron/ascorbate family oxidoreductase [Handroanthus impetiginosus]|uniref:Iron/ascorbate family oxidoreductase n=1 Tax=Handroanthus impetiginosus TaxID=429701 RepID=A0A2G9HXH4_9LAMI|nr:Iron/ascorbate family oxidoreductase [Handroanthus impetiginosus]
MAAKPEVVCFKQVQEMVENGDELPHRYIWSDMNSNYGPVDLNVPPATEIPVIDVGRLVSSSSAMDDELVKLRSALSSWGCFQAVNHGIENWFLDEVRQLAREFFHLPMVEKQKCARSGNDYEGYGNDIVLYENQPLDWNDSLYLLVSPQDRQKLQYWPQNPPSFRKVLEDYTASLGQLQEILLKSMARSLSIPEDSFLNQYGERPTMYGRFNYYPPCSKPDLVFGLKPHADGSGLTFLLQDKQVRGLQLMKDNHWFSVPIMPHALVVNVGDQLEIMSNGIFKSPVHRAVASSERERTTLAIFFLPDPSKDVEPVEELVDDERPKLFKKVKHYTETYFNYFQQGKRPIDAVRI